MFSKMKCLLTPKLLSIREKEKRENARKKELVSRINRGPSLSEMSVDIKLESKIVSNLCFYLLIDCKINF